MTRTFIAIELGDDARAYLAREVVRLERAVPSVRWVDPANLHLTLVFLGELDDTQLAAAADAAGVAAGTEPFTLAVTGLGSFGPPHAPRVIWAGLGGNLQRLTQLYEALAAALEARGFPREVRPFAPHLTLARLKAPLLAADAQRLARALHTAASGAPQPGAQFPVDHISVMKSELLRPAARYTSLFTIPLSAGPC